MLIYENKFKQKVTISHCKHEEYYNTSDLRYSINKIFELPEIKNRVRGEKWDSQYGEGETSEIIPFIGPANIPGTNNLIEWIKSESSKAYKLFYGEDIDEIVIERSWMNKMEYGSQGRCHNHLAVDNHKNDRYNLGKTPDLVAIFYVNNPKDGAELILIKDAVHGKFSFDFPDTDRDHIKINSGDLIIHKPDLWHAVGVHNSKDSRICFVFHISSEKKNDKI